MDNDEVCACSDCSTYAELDKAKSIHRNISIVTIVGRAGSFEVLLATYLGEVRRLFLSRSQRVFCTARLYTIV